MNKQVHHSAASPLEPATVEKIPVIVKASDSARGQSKLISVPSTWTQRELCDYLRSLNGISSQACSALTLEGKQLKEPHARLSAWNSLKPYSLISFETSLHLSGGMRGKEKVSNKEDHTNSLSIVSNTERKGLLDNSGISDLQTERKIQKAKETTS